MSVAGATVAVLIPAYNEETQLAGVLAGLPAFVDRVLVVDDASTDRTAEVVAKAAAEDERIALISFPRNRGVGAAMAAAYEWARDEGVDVAVSIDADGQMDPGEMIHLVQPIVEGRADFTKGNRLASTAQWAHIPRVRLLGNAALSLLTKIASGYWSVADSQSGYTALSRYALEAIDWRGLYRGYGRPNDLLVRANVANCRVADVPIRPIYGVGERSTMRIVRVLFPIAFMLFRRFWWRMFHKYVLRDFHPLVFFYLLALATFVADIGFAARLVTLWIADGNVPPITALTVAFLTITTLNSVFFAYWMDMQVNAPLAVRPPDYYAVRQEVSEGGPSRAATETAAARSLPESSGEQGRRTSAPPSG